MPYTDLQLKEKANDQFNPQNFYIGIAADTTQEVLKYLPLPPGQAAAVDFLFSTLTLTEQYKVNLRNTGSGYEAFIPALGKTVADISLSGALTAAVSSIGIAVGVTAGLPLTITAIVASSILMETNVGGIPSLWQEGLTEVLKRYDADGTQGIRTLIQQKSETLLEYWDAKYGDPSNPTPISDKISDMSNFFENLKLTPLIVDVQNNGLGLTSLVNGDYFDFDNDGFAEKGGWIAPSEAFLVRDTNANGMIDNVTEMFGANGGTTAYAKLAALDANRDGKLTGTELSTLKLWQDANSNGITDVGELKTLASASIAQIDVTKQAYTATNAGNTVDGFVNIKNASGAVISKAYDVAFAVDQVNSWYVGSNLATSPAVSVNALLSPLSRGFGEVKSLHLALTENAALKTQVDTITNLTIATGMTLVNQHINTMLTLWSNQESVAANSRARLVNGSPINYVNGQTLGIIEKFVGEKFVNIDGFTSPDAIGSLRLNNAYFSLAEHMKETILVQSVFKDVFSTSYYSFATGDVVMNDTLANILNRANALEPTDATQNKAYWGHIGGILASHAAQFGSYDNAVLAQVNAKAGFVVEHYTLTLNGSAGVDALDGTAGSDTIFALAGNDSLTGGNGNDSLSGGDGNDAVYGDYGNDTVDGGLGNDSLRGGGNDDLVTGGAGNDSLDGGYDNDTLIGGVGIDRLTGDAGADSFTFNKGDIVAGTNADHITDFSIAQGDKIVLLGYGLSAAGFVGTGIMVAGGAIEFGYTKVAAGNYTLIRIDSDNNGTSDQEIRLDGIQLDLQISDFLFA